MTAKPDPYQTALDRYRDPRVIARNLEAEWADFLQSCPGMEAETEALFNFGVRTTPFYGAAVEWSLPWLGTPARILEIGCACGRVLWELANRFPRAEELLGVDTAPMFISLAEEIVGAGPPPAFLPVPTGSDRGYDFVATDGALDPVAAAVQGQPLRFLQCRGEEVPRPAGYFDAVFCLNVVDRHPEPQVMMDQITNLLTPGGTVVMASPHDWQAQYTRRENWVTDLRRFFEGPPWELLGSTDLDYPLRMNPRLIWMFKTQLVVARRQAGPCQAGPRQADP